MKWSITIEANGGDVTTHFEGTYQEYHDAFMAFKDNKHGVMMQLEGDDDDTE